MSWPKELSEIKYSKIKNIHDLIEGDSYFSKIEVHTSWDYNEFITPSYKLDFIKIFDKAGDPHFFGCSFNGIQFSFRRMTRNGKNTRSHHEYISIDDAKKAVENIKEFITLKRQASEFEKRQESKREQMNSITSIIIDGLGAKYPKVKTALDAKHRGSRNFLDHEFKKNRLILHAKLTIEDRTKLEKLFQVLEEIV